MKSIGIIYLSMIVCTFPSHAITSEKNQVHDMPSIRFEVKLHPGSGPEVFILQSAMDLKKFDEQSAQIACSDPEYYFEPTEKQECLEWASKHRSLAGALAQELSVSVDWTGQSIIVLALGNRPDSRSTAIIDGHEMKGEKLVVTARDKDVSNCEGHVITLAEQDPAVAKLVKKVSTNQVLLELTTDTTCE
jgi:hypothetical protein